MKDGVFLVRHGKPFQSCVYGYLSNEACQNQYNRFVEEINMHLTNTLDCNRYAAELQ